MTAERIKLSALKLFADHGYEGTSMSTIAESVGIQKASLYSHFSSKEDLFLRIVRDLSQANIDRIHSLSSDIQTFSTKEKLYRIYQYASRCSADGSEDDKTVFWVRTAFFPPQELKERLGEHFQAYEKELSKLVTSILREGFANGAIKVFVLDDLLASFYCLIDGILIETFYYATRRNITWADTLWEIFWAGIKGLER